MFALNETWVLSWTISNCSIFILQAKCMLPIFSAKRTPNVTGTFTLAMELQCQLRQWLFMLMPFYSLSSNSILVLMFFCLFGLTTIQRAMIHMSGYDDFWFSGIDHVGIAAQVCYDSGVRESVYHVHGTKICSCYCLQSGSIDLCSNWHLLIHYVDYYWLLPDWSCVTIFIVANLSNKNASFYIMYWWKTSSCVRQSCQGMK